MAPSSRSPSYFALLATVLPLIAPSDAFHTRDDTSTCSGLASALSSNTTFTVTNVTYYAANASIDTSTTGGSNTGAGGAATFSGLPAFCRVQLDLNTYNGSNATAEVWLPDSSSWSGRFLAVGGGGLEGSINYQALAYSGLNQSFAAVSTNAGHDSTEDITWWTSNPDAVIDFGWRAMHTAVDSGKTVVSNYYGSSANKSYYTGCSDGGRQGLQSFQMFPEDFDGVVVGSPAAWLSHQQAWSIWMTKHVFPVNGSSWIPSDMWSVIGDEVIKQCDTIDGVADGIINDPWRCYFRPETLACRSNSTDSCLTSDQIDALNKIYHPWIDVNQTYVFDGYLPGGEAQYGSVHLASTAPDSIGLNFFEYLVYNDTNWDWQTLTYADAVFFEELNPGQMIANSHDLTEFAGESHNGKVIHFVGLGDPNISPGQSLHYYRQVEQYMNLNSDLDIDDYYRFFPVPGMAHCSGGIGANAFGAADTSAATPPLAYDADHSALLAMVQWVEEGIAPSKIIATKYVDDDSSNGVNFTRPICMYPQEITYTGNGSIWNATNFDCE